MASPTQWVTPSIFNFSYYKFSLNSIGALLRSFRFLTKTLTTRKCILSLHNLHVVLSKNMFLSLLLTQQLINNQLVSSKQLIKDHTMQPYSAATEQKILLITHLFFYVFSLSLIIVTTYCPLCFIEIDTGRKQVFVKT